MNEQLTPPLKIDLRLALESVAGTLAFVLAGIAAVDLTAPWSILIPLCVGAVIVLINRLLGRSSEAAISELTGEVRALIAQNTVFRADAKPSVKRAADEAGEALRPATPPSVHAP